MPKLISDNPRKENVIGQSREFIDDFLNSIKSEGLYSAMGVHADKSFLITGSHGNGKTLSIDALVNEANKDVYERGMDGEKVTYELCAFEYSQGKYGTAYINEGSKIIQGFFDNCFNYANHGFKTLIIFDEAETLFGKRMNGNAHKEDAKVLNTIMTNMQILHNTENIYSVMLSNFPDAFDEASIRAGRIDKHYKFTKPNKSERNDAFRFAINKINEKAGYSVIRNYDIYSLSDISDGFSYSDVVESISSAVRLRAKQLSEIRSDKIIRAGYVRQNRLEQSVINHRDMFTKNKKIDIGFKLK